MKDHGLMNIACYYCNKSCKNQQTHTKSCEEFKKIKLSMTEDVLRDLYINKNMSCLDIQKHFGLQSYNCIYGLFKKYNIKIRSWQDVAKLARVKSSKTNLKQYGAKHNFCKNHPSRKNWEKRLFEEEGITNVFQRESVKAQITASIVERYGVEHAGHLTTHRGKNVYSSIHRTVVKLCQDLNMGVKIEYKIKNENRYYSYDIIIDNTNKLIEVNGDYWHGNPKIYKVNDLIMKGSSVERTVGDKWGFDKKKIDYAISLGFEVLVIWEYDLNNNLEEVKESILRFVGQ